MGGGERLPRTSSHEMLVIMRRTWLWLKPREIEAMREREKPGKDLEQGKDGIREPRKDAGANSRQERVEAWIGRSRWKW